MYIKLVFFKVNHNSGENEQTDRTCIIQPRQHHSSDKTPVALKKKQHFKGCLMSHRNTSPTGSNLLDDIFF